MSFVLPARPTSTLRARLTLWYLAMLALTLFVFAGLLYLSLSRSLYRHHDSELAAEAERLTRAVGAGALSPDTVADVLARIKLAAPIVMVRNREGDLIWGSAFVRASDPNVGRHEALVHAVMSAQAGPQFFTATLERLGPVRFICTPISAGRRFLQIGQPLGDVRATLDAIATASALLVPVVLLLTSFGGWVIAKRALAPMSAVDTALATIQATDLSRRIEIRPADAELSGLVTSVNALLERLDRSFRSLREFAADASHQLQTPLTVMKGSLEVAQASDREPAAYRELLAELTVEVNDLIAIVSDLRSLSLADVDAYAGSSAEVDLSDVWAEAADIVSALGEARGVAVSVDIQSGVTVRGDAVRLKQVLLNLGDNAVKYTPPGGRVHIAAAAHGQSAVLKVDDSGPGIAAAQLSRVFDRFYRVNPTGGAAGTGLGLAIVKRIVEAHHGTVSVTSTAGKGAAFSVTLPLLRGQHPSQARRYSQRLDVHPPIAGV